MDEQQATQISPKREWETPEVRTTHPGAAEDNTGPDIDAITNPS